ncbi:hypothetical protein CHUAL_004236 [Chamberlinius hualienensis]
MESQMRAKAYRLCCEFLGGAWKTVRPEEIVVSRFSGGLSNFLYFCALPNSTSPLSDEPSQVLLRIYGQMHDNDVVENVITQSVIFTLLSERCLGPKLYGVFPEGRIEEYIPARPLLTKELRDPKIATSIAERLAKVHSLRVPINKEPNWLSDTMDRWLQKIRTKITVNAAKSADQEKARKVLSFPLEKEYDWVMKMIQKLSSPIIFSHNDLQEGNILVQNNTPLSESWLMFIDYEYCSYNYRGFDFGNHFCESCYDYTNPNPPYFYANVANYPSREQQLHFIRAYLRSYFSELNDSSKSVQYNSRTEEKILKEAAFFALVSHFFWGLWAIVNGANAQIEFGYWDYSLARLDAYFKGKSQILSAENANKKTGSD